MDIEGFKWIGHNRKNLHFRSRVGSGGVGLLIKVELYEQFDISLLNNEFEGILWIKFSEKFNDRNTFTICVCYLPPENSSRQVCANDFYETLLSHIYMYQQLGPFYICGDFNSRIGNEQDFILGVDDIQERSPIDFSKNTYGEKLLDFLISASCCVANGRPSVCIQDDFTSISQKGKSVVDYCIVSHEALWLQQIKDFAVTPAHDRIQNNIETGSVDLVHKVPDHSLLTWTICLDGVSENIDIQGAQIKEEKTVFVRDIPLDFMSQAAAIAKIDEFISQLDNEEKCQRTVDENYDKMCMAVQDEMKRCLPHKTVVIKSGVSNKHRKIKKPWWNDGLTELWNILCDSQRHWRKANAGNKQLMKHNLKVAQKNFDRAVQKAKRQHWQKVQEELLHLHQNESKEFWKTIGRVGVGAERPKIPWEVCIDGSVVSTPQVVLDTWKNGFQGLLNGASSSSQTDELPLNNMTVPSTNDPGMMTARISEAEIRKQMLSMKKGKACGVDNLPLEVFQNGALLKYMTSLFNTCFDHQFIPTLWTRGIINPIPKDNTKDPREPMNSRGITLACVMYKIYCGVLNKRICKWAESNELLVDEQNGFRKGRSTLDQLSTLTSIIDQRKAKRLSTFVAFIDFSKAYDCINRMLLWYKLDKIGMPVKMLSALKCIYNKVECCVRINGIKTDWFDVGLGLKQGCLISPILFNLYVNDLANDIKDAGIGVKCGDDLVSVLLYADDICLIAESEQELQKLLDILNSWCVKWKMQVNTQKSQIVHFRNNAKTRSNAVFNFGDDRIDIVSSYKYLGLVITEHMDYHVMAKMVSQAAGRALGLLIAKFKSCGGMPYEVYTKLYDVLVQSVINYGAAIWGSQSHSCIMAVQMRASRYFLGVGKYTPNTAVLGDMGWDFPKQRIGVSIARLWCRLTNLNNSRLNKRVFTWAKHEPQGRNTWYKRVCNMFMDIDENFCSTEHFHNVRSTIANVNQMFHEKLLQEWKNDLNRIESRQHGNGRNKLRTYRLFKSEFGVESYVFQNLPRKYRSSFAKFRCGVAPIRIETGRYCGLEENMRVCYNCEGVIENEIHVITECPKYSDIRADLYEHVRRNIINFDSLNNEQIFMVLFKEANVCFYVAKACDSILNRYIIYNSR